MAERPAALVIEFPHLTPKQQASVEAAVEDAMIEWSFSNPVSWAMSVVKPPKRASNV